MVLSFKKVDELIIKKIINCYFNFQINNNDSYKKFVFKVNTTTISIYFNNTVLFQGKNAEELAKKFFATNLTHNNNISLQQNNYYYEQIIGNDEVGVGDIFGPIVFTSSYFSKENLIKLKLLKIRDSKKISDQEIINLAPQIIKNIKFSTVVIDNLQYNNLYQEYQNSHVIKAIGHNEALKKIIKNYPELNNKKIIIDQFVNKNKYLEYLNKEQEIITNNLFLIPKGEEQFLAIACSSIISRYYFLETIKNLEKKWQIALPLGSSNSVKKLAESYYQKLSHNNCINFMKLHFNRTINKK